MLNSSLLLIRGTVKNYLHGLHGFVANSQKFVVCNRPRENPKRSKFPWSKLQTVCTKLYSYIVLYYTKFGVKIWKNPSWKPSWSLKYKMQYIELQSLCIAIQNICNLRLFFFVHANVFFFCIILYCIKIIS